MVNKNEGQAHDSNKGFKIGSKVIVHDVDGDWTATIKGEPYESNGNVFQMIQGEKGPEFGELVSIMSQVSDSMQEIETKLLAILEVKRIREGLEPDELKVYYRLTEKYRTDGKLKEGSFFINSNSEWEQVCRQTSYIPSGKITIPSNNKEKPVHDRTAFRAGSKGF